MWQIEARPHLYNQHNHVIVHCLYIDHFVCIVCYRIDVQTELEATPFVEDIVIEISSARQAAPL